MKHKITIKDLIYFGAVGEAYKMKGLKLQWNWKYACGCTGNASQPIHTYADCQFQDNLFWSDRFVEMQRTIKMALQQDEVETVTCQLTVTDEETTQLRAISTEAEDLLGEIGMEYYEIFMQRQDAEQNIDRLSVMDEHYFYTRGKDWYLQNNVNPIAFEEIKVNVCCKFLAGKLLNQLIHKKEAVIEAVWTPNITDDEELLFEEHTVKIDESGHVTTASTEIKAESQ